MCAPMYSAEPPRAGRPSPTAMTWTGWSIGVVMATPLEHRCRCGPAADAGRRGAVRLWGLLLHERRSTGAVRAPVAGRMLFSMRKPCPDGSRLPPGAPSRTPLHCASHVPHAPRPAPHQPRPAPNPLTALDRQPFGCLLSTRSQTAAYFLPIRKRAQYQGAQHVGHQASRGHHRPR
jgi:hypothetical protein